jgi:tetratricopeptide (TPR) repeat protein
MSRCATLLFLTVCFLQIASAVDQELELIRRLTAEGFPGLAAKVLDRTLQSDPRAQSAAPELQARILIAQKNFSEAQTRIDRLDDPQPLRLFLAETAAAVRQTEIAAAAYAAFFNALTEADDTAVRAAFNYGELLRECGDTATAEKMYEQVLSFPSPGNAARPVKVRLAAMIVDRDPSRALTLAESVQLGGLDFWFGEAVVVWAQAMTATGGFDDVQPVLEMQLAPLRKLEQTLEAQGQPVSTVSPLAGARYHLGLCYEQAGRHADALHQLYNVYARYGDSEWGPKANEHSQKLISFFEAQGKTVTIDPGANRSKMEESAFRVARRLFADGRFGEAAPLYLDALNTYPEGTEAVTVLRELILCTLHLNEPLHARTLGCYLAERFADRPAAGDALLAAGKGALDAEEDDLAQWMYDLYIEAFPSHPRAPAVLYSLAALRKQEGLLHRIIERFPENPYAVRARGRLAQNAFEAEEYETAAEHFSLYVDVETDPQKKTRGRFALAESYRFSGRWQEALDVFQALETSLNNMAESYGIPEETVAFNRPFLEKSVYYQAVCHAQDGALDEAVAVCTRFLDQFPASDILEQVRFTQGKTLIEAGDFAAALTALKPFGDATEHRFAEPVFYYRGVAQFETGAYAASVQSLDNLLTVWPASAFFFEAQFVQGRALLATGERGEAVRVFGDLLNCASDDLLLHRAGLELGRAQTDPAEKLASFQRVALLADPGNEEHLPLIAQALCESLPLYLELDRPQDLLADADRLTADFPMFRETNEIQQLCERAKQQQNERPANEYQ